MQTELLLKYSDIGLVVLSLAILVVLVRKRLVGEFPALACLLALQSVDSSIAVAILYYRKALGIEIHLAYNIYFYSHWISQALDVVLRIMVIYSVFSLAMRPLEGLHNIGKIIFRWVAAVSIIVSVAIAAGPHSTSGGYGMTVAIASAVGQMQQGISVLTICLLLFVCFSTRPLGLTFRSRIFGVSLGLGIMAMTTLVHSAWLSTSGAQSLYSPIYLFSVIGSIAAVGVWGGYFAMPEPARRMILLPTTSPFFFWNSVSEALGDSPGHVVVAGFDPGMLAPAELQMLTAPNLPEIAVVADPRHTELPAHAMKAYATN